MAESVLKIANSFGLWIIAFCVVIFVLIQAILYTKLAFKSAEEIGFPREKCVQGFKSGMISAIGPAVAVFIVMVGMMTVLGNPITWMWLTMIGSAATKLIAADLSAQAMGVKLGTPSFTDVALANAYWAMAINGIGWILFVAFFGSKMMSIREKIGGGDPKWLGIFGMSASLGAFAFLNSKTLFNSAVGVLSNLQGAFGSMGAALGGILGMICLQLIARKVLWLREYTLGIAMIIGIGLGMTLG